MSEEINLKAIEAQIENKDIVIPAGTEFRKALDEAMSDLSGMKSEFGDPAEAKGNPISRIIETEEEAKELLAELKTEEDPKVRALKAKADIQAQLDQMERIWKTLPRKRKRQLMKPKFKFSSRVKSLLQRAGI